MADMTRDEHLRWCKQRALEYLDRGELQDAVSSMLSDLNKHPDTRGIGEKLAPLAMLYLTNGDATGVRRFIEGFREGN